MSNRPSAKKHLLSAAAIALLGSSLALSQTFGQAQPPANNVPAASSAGISDQKLKEAAAAIPQVEGIRQNYQQQLAQAPDGDKQRIQNQAGDEMKKAIADQGLSVAEYNSILQTAEQNADVRARLIKQMPETSGADEAPGP
jgi:hypothetical protein